MKHFVILYYILSFSIGFIAIYLSYYLYLRYKNRIILYYLFFLLAFTFNFIANSFNFYQNSIIGHSTETYNLIYLYLRIIGRGLIYYTVPLFIYHLIDRKFAIAHKTIFGSLSAVAFLFIPFSLFLGSGPDNTIQLAQIGYRVFSIIFLIMVLYFITLALMRYRKVKNKDLKFFIKTLFITTTVSFPIIFTESIFPIFRFPSTGRPISFSGLSIFYLIWNSVTLFIVARYFLRPKLETSQNLPIELFAKRYGITKREMEIITEISKGKSNREISQSLFISLPTVKTHIRNIYQKSRVKNRVELINSIQNQPDSLISS